MVDINLLTLESIRQSYLNLSRTNLCILCRFQSNLFLISTSLCHCNQVVLRSNVHGNRIVRGIICSYGNIQIGFLYNGNGSIIRNLAVRIQLNLVVLYKFSQSLRLVVWRNRSGVRQLGRSYAFADSLCSIFIFCSDFTAQSCSSSTSLGIGLDYVFVLNFNGANSPRISSLCFCTFVGNNSQTSSTIRVIKLLSKYTTRDDNTLIITRNSIFAAIDSRKFTASYIDINSCNRRCRVILRIAFQQTSITRNHTVRNRYINRQFSSMLCNCNACTNRSRTITIRCYTGRNSIASYSCAIYCQLTCTNFNTCLAATNTATINSSSCITSQIHTMTSRSNSSRIQINYRRIYCVCNLTININARTNCIGCIILRI